MKNLTIKNRLEQKHLAIMFCFVFMFCMPVLAQSDYAVLVQESPVGAGEIKPGIGIHNFGVNEVVTLTTVARPGWRFVYWLGEVSDPTANRTVVSVDGPKIVIAVFQRDEFELLGGGMAASSGPESLTARYDSFSTGGLSGAYYPSSSSSSPSYTPEEDETDDPPPVPEVPEPATVLLLGIGTLVMTIKSRKG